jgi:hypothetical protein
MAKIEIQDFRKIKMIDFEQFLILGNFGSINKSSSYELILESFGEPDVITPVHESNLLMILYGDLEFRLREGYITMISLLLKEEQPTLPKTISFENLPIQEKRNFEFVEALLKENKVDWKKDDFMSDEYQLIYITEKGVHFAFGEEVLGRVAAVYSVD